jgi:hypothetical protein
LQQVLVAFFLKKSASHITGLQFSYNMDSCTFLEKGATHFQRKIVQVAPKTIKNITEKGATHFKNHLLIALYYIGKYTTHIGNQMNCKKILEKCNSYWNPLICTFLEKNATHTKKQPFELHIFRKSATRMELFELHVS